MNALAPSMPYASFLARSAVGSMCSTALFRIFDDEVAYFAAVVARGASIRGR